MSGTAGKTAQTCRRIDNELPMLKYLGFSFWVAWFGSSYNSNVWITPSEANTAVVNEMFVVSTFAHVAALAVCALFYRSVGRIARRPGVIVLLAVLASAGCLFTIAAGPLYAHSHALFLVGSCLTGMGTAALCVNSGLLLCALKPGELLKTLLVCESISCLLTCTVASLPPAAAQGAYVALPLLAALCFVVGTSRAEDPCSSEQGRLKPTSAFGRYLAAVFMLCLLARTAEGFFSTQRTPDQLGFFGSLTMLATAATLGCLVIVGALLGDRLRFSPMFYTVSVLITASTLAFAFVPGGDTGLAGVVSAVAFQLFDVATWYACGYIVYQSKTSALLLVALTRATLSMGVTAGAQLGGTLANAAPSATLPLAVCAGLVALFVAAVALVFPPRQIPALLLPIPDEDEPGDEVAIETHEHGRPSTTGETEAAFGPRAADGAPAASGHPVEDSPVCNASSRSAATGTSEHAETPGPNGTVAADAKKEDEGGDHPSRWKTLCLALADEAGLTEREKEVFVLLAKGRGSQSISDALTVSLYTTRAHTRNIYAKLDVHSRHELSERVQSYVDAHQGQA